VPGPWVAERHAWTFGEMLFGHRVIILACCDGAIFTMPASEHTSLPLLAKQKARSCALPMLPVQPAAPT
jgi:hypothetical protein